MQKWIYNEIIIASMALQVYYEIISTTITLSERPTALYDSDVHIQIFYMIFASFSSLLEAFA